MKHCTRCGIEKPLSGFYRKNGKAISECRDCCNKVRRKYRSAHPDVISKDNDQSRQYYRENKERCCAVSRNYRQTHREQDLEWHRKYYLEHREQCAARGKRWRQAHPEKDKEYCARYHLHHPETGRNKRRRRRAILAQVGGTFTEAEFQELLQRCEGKCVRCGTRENLCADHIVPISKGGANTIDNIQPLCRKCNAIKGNKLQTQAEMTCAVQSDG